MDRLQHLFTCRIKLVPRALLLAFTLLGGISPYLWADTLNSNAQRLRQVNEMYAHIKEGFPQVADIEPKAAMDLLADAEVVFVDVRRTKEQAISMIPGAVTEHGFMERLERYRDRRVIVYCTIGYRSGKLAKRLRGKGVAAVNLKAGILGWTHAGGALTRDGRPVKQLHVFGRKWDLAPTVYQTVYFKGLGWLLR